MLNWVFLILVGGAVITAAFTGTMKQVTDASLSSAKAAVELAIGLIGQMGLWLGFMRVLQDAGMMRTLSRLLAPVMRRLFPDVPGDHPAMGAMIMNIAANMLGLGNAATPFGLKAMVELDKLNPRKGVATNAMALFLAINTSGVAVLPLGVIAVRATLGSSDAAGIVIPSIIATALSTLTALIVVKLLEKRRFFALERYELASEGTTATQQPIKGLEQAEQLAAEVVSASRGRTAVAAVVWLAVAAALVPFVRNASGTGLEITRALMSDWLLPVLMLAIVTVGFARKVKVYESFIAGAKDAFQIAVTIIPFLLAIIVAIGMFRASGAMEALTGALSPITGLIGMPAETLPMALIRPLSGSGALAVMTETMRTYGPDSLIGYIVSIMNGSTETTFYVLAVYFGAVQVRAARHTVAACLCADTLGILGSVLLARLFFG
ncbi:MAG: nucleoside recognition domain-containing protein [Myxococcales bacterium]